MEPSDRLRQVGVTVAEVFCVVGTLVGVGVLGTRVEESSGGALAADATLLAPAGPAFAIWTPIYLGLAAYTVWQWLPEQATDRRHRAIGWLAAASMVLNARLAPRDPAGLDLGERPRHGRPSSPCLGLLVRRLEEHPSYGHGETVRRRRHLRAVPGLGRRGGVRQRHRRPRRQRGRPRRGCRPAAPRSSCSAWPRRWGCCSRERLGGRWAVAVALAWGLLGSAWGRLADEPRSVLVGLAALVGPWSS